MDSLLAGYGSDEDNSSDEQQQNQQKSLEKEIVAEKKQESEAEKKKEEEKPITTAPVKKKLPSAASLLQANTGGPSFLKKPMPDDIPEFNALDNNNNNSNEKDEITPEEKGERKRTIAADDGLKDAVSALREKHDSKKAPDVKDKEKNKRMKGQSVHERWKSEGEMLLRQQFD